PRPGVIRLRPRPRADCGPLDAEWLLHERRGTTAFAKQHLCGGACPKRANCFWPTQYGSGLRGARVVLGTHQHLLLNRRFLPHLRMLPGASRVLLLLDEADVLAASFRTALTARTLARFLAAVHAARLGPGVRERWAEQLTLLLGARTEDLRAA